MIIELPQDWGNRLLEGTNKPVGTRTQEKEAVNPHETEQDLPLSKNLQWRPGLTVAFCRVRGSEYNSVGISPFKRGLHYCDYPYHSLASGQTTGREHSPINRKLD